MPIDFSKLLIVFVWCRQVNFSNFVSLTNRRTSLSVCCLSNSSPASSQTSSSSKGSFRSCDFEVFGKVQGVYFRKYTQHQAKNLNLVGWVQNTVRDTVEGYMEGEKTNIDQMKEWLQKTGSPSSKVTKVEFKNEKSISELTGNVFEIRR